MNNFYLKLILFLIPFLLVFQPYFPDFFQYFLISMRYIIIPLWIISKIKKSSDFTWIIFAIVYFTLILLVSSENPQKPHITFLNVVSCICYYIFASNINIDNRFDTFSSLLNGINFVNFFTLIVYIFTILDIIDLASFFRDDSTGFSYLNNYDRFSFGNSIETPFTITLLLYITMLTNPKKSILFSAGFNLSVAFISGSRIVTLIALLLFVYELFRSNIKYKTVITLIVIITGYFFSALIQTAFGTDLLLDRFLLSLDTDRSALERALFFFLYFEELQRFSVYELFFGHGFNYTYKLLGETYGIIRSIESVFMQLFFEVGLVGLLIALYNVIKNSLNKNLFSIQGILNFLVIIQLLFFLPIYTFMQIAFLLAGFLKINKLKF